MRRSYVLVALAVTSMVALAFAIPLALLVRVAVRDRAMQDAERRAAAVAPLLAITEDPPVVTAAIDHSGARGVAVVLPDGTVIGTGHAGRAGLDQVRAGRRALNVDVPGGVCLLRPVVQQDGQVAVIEVYVTTGELDKGVGVAWAILGAVAAILVGGSVLLADRLATGAVRATRRLAAIARRLSTGDLRARAEPTGPAEVTEVAGALNTLAEAFEARLAAEREFAADLSHRLRTPLTAVRLNTEALPDGDDRAKLLALTAELEREVSMVIQQARHPYPTAYLRCDLVAVVADRVAFWAPLAEDQGRPWAVAPAAGPLPVPLGAEDAGDALDAVIGNVFQHTPEGAGCQISVYRDGAQVLVHVDDAGPGIDDPDTAVRRGASGKSSTGLGLDIARRVAESTGGAITVAAGPLGGARVTLAFGLVTPTGRARVIDRATPGLLARLLRRGRRRMVRGPQPARSVIPETVIAPPAGPNT